MSQSQTSYEVVDGQNVEIPSTPYPNETTLDRLRLYASKRFGRKGNVQLSATYATIDAPYFNPTAMCEEGLHGEENNLVGHGSVYYFQRFRFGNATNQPSDVQRYTARGSYRFSGRSSVSGWITAGFDENDQLNLYTFERDLILTGVNLWAAPTDRFMVALGYSFNRVESNANLCPPIFDG
jgi:hypothetical protein